MTENDIRANLSRNIKTFRQLQSLSQADLAERADISIPFLSQIECANKFPSPAILARIADSLQVSVSDLFAEKENIKSGDYKFMIEAMKSILNGQLLSFENFCERYFENDNQESGGLIPKN